MPEYQLHLGDCIEQMRLMKDKEVCLTLTDPSYGINIIRGGGRGINGWRDFRSDGDWDKSRPTKEYFDQIFRVSKNVIIWGGNYFTDFLRPSQQWLIWNKGQRKFSLADGELAWSSLNKAVRIFDLPRSAMRKEGGLHPTQKPVSLMKWCIEKFKNIETVFDPFMGSGTTGVAALQLGYKFIGCEGNPKYFTIAANRILDTVKEMEHA